VNSSEPSGGVSRRAMLLQVPAGACALALGGCASLEASGFGASGERFDASQVSASPAVLVATTRKPADGAKAKPWFGSERASTMRVVRAKLTPPGDGRFSLAAVGLDDWRLDAIAEAPELGGPFGEGISGGEVLVYVHGFNQTFETAVLDAARLSDGIKFHGETVAFSWPSKASLLDYGYDRDSAMWSRDALESVLDGLMTNPKVTRIHVVAHSIGTMLTLEALRQLYAHHGEAVAAPLGAVVFAAPDIDMDVFTSSVGHIGPIAGKITVLTATNDRALAISRWMAGGMTRVGAAQKAQLEKLGLHVVDGSREGWGVINHDLFLSNAKIRQVIRHEVDSPRGV
jgi:esterase/lipase superfamily enzyme